MRYDYEQSIRLSSESFYSLIMAAMRGADTDNLEKLQAAWPGVWRELQDRYQSDDEKVTTAQEPCINPKGWIVRPGF